MHAERQLHLAAIAEVRDGRIEGAEKTDAPVVTEADAVTLGQALGGLCEGAPVARIDPLVTGEGDQRACVLQQPLAMQRRADHARIVEDQGVARPQKAGQVAHQMIRKLGSAAFAAAGPHHQKPGRIARIGGFERDTVLRQIECEKVGAHDRTIGR
jgi:hypothetical protein